MSITTGAELATAVANWMARADLTSRIPEFVALAEAKLNRLLRTPQMETKVTFAINGEYVALPTGFLEARSFVLDSDPFTALMVLPPETQSGYLIAGSGVPAYYSVVGSNFHFAPIPAATYNATLVYYAAPTTVSTGGSAQNWLLTANPDLYLYGTLVEAAAYLPDESKARGWADAYGMALDQVKRQGARTRWSGGSMATRPG